MTVTAEWEISLQQPAIWREKGEYLTAGLGMKCLGIDKYVKGNQCRRS
jgi:hypothetical protein